MWPAVWAPSTMKKISLAWRYSAIGLISCTEPSTLLPCVITTSRVSGRIAFLIAARLTLLSVKGTMEREIAPSCSSVRERAEYRVVFEFCGDRMERGTGLFHKSVNQQVE